VSARRASGSGACSPAAPHDNESYRAMAVLMDVQELLVPIGFCGIGDAVPMGA
jgi:hypothetical protein